jgi:putative FmdB family regulatory protein
MPTYEMTCRGCGTRFERFLTRLLRDEDKVCPSCGSAEVDQGVGGGYVSRPAPEVKGTGCTPRGGFG